MNAPAPGSGLGRLIVSGLLAIAGVTGLLASLCGGFFTLSAMASQGMVGLLVISLPSLLIGGAIAWLCFRALRRRHGGTAPPDAPA